MHRQHTPWQSLEDENDHLHGLLDRYERAPKPEPRRRRVLDRDWSESFEATLAAHRTPCRACGHADVIEFHHRNPRDKRADVQRMRVERWSPEEVSAELAKCMCLCPTCHRLYHRGKIDLPADTATDDCLP
jgi:hypothetical protein